MFGLLFGLLFEWPLKTDFTVALYPGVRMLHPVSTEEAFCLLHSSKMHFQTNCNTESDP